MANVRCRVDVEDGSAYGEWIPGALGLACGSAKQPAASVRPPCPLRSLRVRVMLRESPPEARGSRQRSTQPPGRCRRQGAGGCHGTGGGGAALLEWTSAVKERRKRENKWDWEVEEGGVCV